MATGLGAAMQALAVELGLDLGREGDRFRARERIAAQPWPRTLSPSLKRRVLPN